MVYHKFSKGRCVGLQISSPLCAPYVDPELATDPLATDPLAPRLEKNGSKKADVSSTSCQNPPQSLGAQRPQDKKQS